MDWNFFQPFLPSRHKSVSHDSFNASADVSCMLHNLKQNQHPCYTTSSFPIGKMGAPLPDYISPVNKPTPVQNSLHFMSFSLNVPLDSGQMYGCGYNPNMKCSFPLNPYAKEFIPNKHWNFHPSATSKQMSTNLITNQRPLSKSSSISLFGDPQYCSKIDHSDFRFCLPSEDIINATALGVMRCKVDPSLCLSKSSTVPSMSSSSIPKICNSKFRCISTGGPSNTPNGCKNIPIATKSNSFQNFKIPPEDSTYVSSKEFPSQSSLRGNTLSNKDMEQVANSDIFSSNSEINRLENEPVKKSTTLIPGKEGNEGQNYPSIDLIEKNSSSTEKSIPEMVLSNNKSTAADSFPSDLESENDNSFEECPDDKSHTECLSCSYVDDSSVDFTFSPASESFISSSVESTKMKSDQIDPKNLSPVGCNILSFILNPSPTDNFCSDDVYDNSDYDYDIFDLDLDDCSELGFSIGGALVVPSCSRVQSCDKEVHPSTGDDAKRKATLHESDNDNKEILDDVTEANERWNKEIDINCVQRTPSKVIFSTNVDIHPVENWDRAGPWEEYARDRMRFQKRIEEMEEIIAPILQPAHRSHILERLERDL